MAWYLTKDDQNNVFLGFKDTVASDLGPIKAFQESARGENILNVKCENGGKAVKISSFVKAKSVGVFAKCTSATSFHSQLESFVSKERSVSKSSRSPSSHNGGVVPSCATSSRTPTGTPNSGSASMTNKTPVTPDSGNDGIQNTADTPCTSKRQRIRKRRLPEPDAADIIQRLPRKDVLSPLQQRFEECKVGKSND